MKAIAFQPEYYDRNIKDRVTYPSFNAEIARLRTGVGAGIPVYIWRNLPEQYRVFDSQEELQQAIAKYGESEVYA